MKTKKYLRVAALAAAGSLILFGGCGTGGETSGSPSADVEPPVSAGLVAPGDLIAVSLPWVGTQNWAEANELFAKSIEAAGFKAAVQAADNKVPNQQQQIDSFVEQGAKVIIVGAVDGEQLGTVLENAKVAGAVILGYDREIKNTQAVDGVVQYNAFGTGELQAEALLEGLKANVSPDGPWVVELFAGGPADPNAKLFFDGAMSVLQPLIDAKTITITSGQVEFTQVATADWENSKAQSRMDSLLAGNYSAGKGPDGVLSPNDGIARAIITASENAGIKNLPIVDGLDAEDESVQWIRDGKQYATVAKPTQPMIDKTIEITQALELSKDLPAGTSVRSNGVKDVPLFELTPVIVTKANVNEMFPA
ncbi:MAG: sugar-binding protein [Propionibacteriaceae bacterium]|jgi:putative multiple sugar transport system substrate-binding protein|nr:sugar-binding protein [Propionibacteriaceae bacterium]